MSKGVGRVEYQSSTRKARSVFQRLGSPARSSILKWTSPAWGSRAATAQDPVRLVLTVRIPLGRSYIATRRRRRADAAAGYLTPGSQRIKDSAFSLSRAGRGVLGDRASDYP